MTKTKPPTIKKVNADKVPALRGRGVKISPFYAALKESLTGLTEQKPLLIDVPAKTDPKKFRNNVSQRISVWRKAEEIDIETVVSLTEDGKQIVIQLAYYED